MSSSPIFSLRLLQAAIARATGVEVPILALAEALQKEMRSSSLCFSHSSLTTYLNRLRDWKAADEVVVSHFHPIRRASGRATLADVETVYQVYAQAAKEQGLTPMPISRFRNRAYDLPLPKERKGRQ